MINQNKIFEKWLEFQATNPPKTTNILENPQGARCCLGNLCHIAIPDKRTVGHLGKILYSFVSTALPKDVALKLNITHEGRFTLRGKEIALIYLRENNFRFRDDANSFDTHYFCLTIVNDVVLIDHAAIGELIRYLAYVEKDLGIECFEPFPND